MARMWYNFHSVSGVVEKNETAEDLEKKDLQFQNKGLKTVLYRTVSLQIIKSVLYILYMVQYFA